jgi:excisionase family DNA binding protein
MSIERRHTQSETQKVTGIEAGYPRVLIDIDQLSARLCIAKGTLYNWVYLRRIPFVKLGRALRFDPIEIERVLRNSSTMEIAGGKR